MATIIKLKTGTSTPQTSDLESREVAIDTSAQKFYINDSCLLYTSPSPRDAHESRMPSSA